MIFWQKFKRERVKKHIVKNRSTLFCMIYYWIWPNQGTLCLFVCTPDPQKVISIIDNVNSKPEMSRFLSNILGEGGREVNSQHDQRCVKNKFVKNRVRGRGPSSIWIMSVMFLTLPPKDFHFQQNVWFVKVYRFHKLCGNCSSQKGYGNAVGIGPSYKGSRKARAVIYYRVFQSKWDNVFAYFSSYKAPQ